MAQCMIFEEDEISIECESNIKYGLVLESSEYISSDEEENSYWDRVKKGTIRVVWHPCGEEEVVPEKKVKLTDRSLMPGDVVRRLIEGQDSQRGYVKNTNVTCYLQILGKNKVICDVDSKDLQFLEYWDTEPGDVYLDSWVGKIEKIVESITLKFADGARFTVDEEDFYGELSSFEDIHEKRERDSEFAVTCYYPSQRLKGYLSDLHSVKWLTTTKHHCAEAAKKSTEKEVIVTVEKVEPMEMEVHWLCQGFGKVENPDAKMGPPLRNLTKEDIKRLKKLDCFEHCSVQIGDKAFYTLKGTDAVHNIAHKGTKNLMYNVLRLKQQYQTQSNNSSKIIETLNARNSASSHTNPLQTSSHEIIPEHIKDISDKPAKVAKTDSHHAELSKSAAISTFDESSELSEVTPTVQQQQTVDDDDADVSDAESTSSAASSQSTGSNPAAAKKKKSIHKKGGAIPTKILKKKKLKKSKKREEIALWEFKPGDKIACEVICTVSTVQVVWQDGSVEDVIPSTELYPIHHLDELEFFPGDFVVPTSEGENDVEYGVVSSVDHAGRTCMVKWIKPYQSGVANSPVEITECEEVSVYDIKDHLDYKFRPGQVVVRVGGSVDPLSVAAGQVYELGTDGQISIHWSDGARSFCYPQELYLIGDDLSELDSDDDSDGDDDSDSSFHSSEASWETEDETEVAYDEEVSGVDEAEPVCKSKKGPVTHLDDSTQKLFDVAITSLQNLEEFFSLPVVQFCQMECYKEVLKLYKTCKDVDKKINASYFDDPKLKKVISSIKSDMKRERQIHFAKKIKELIEKNQKLQTENLADKENSDKNSQHGEDVSKDIKAEKDAGDSSTEHKLDVMDSSVNEHHPEVMDSSVTEHKPDVIDSSVTADSIDLKVDLKASSASTASESVMEGACALEKPLVSDQTADKNKDTVITSICSESLNKIKEILPGFENMVNFGEGGSISMSGIIDPAFKEQVLELCKDISDEIVNMGKAVDHIDQATQTASNQTDCGKCVNQAKDLCQNACHILRETIIKIREDFAKKQAENKASLEKNTAAGEDELSKKEDAPAQNKSEQQKTGEDVREESMDVSENIVNEVIQDNRKLTLELPPPEDKTEEEIVEDMLKSPITPITPAEIRDKLQFNLDGFTVMESAPTMHNFKNTQHQASDAKSFMSSYRKELKMLSTSLPMGIFVKGFEDRMDLFSIMIHGPKKTPYEDGLFFFDVKLPNDFPNSPPDVYYIAYCSERLNPNLYEDGKVCVSLLGTWQGKGTEVWTKDSNLLQVLISIQGLILVSEPYYNEAGYEKQKGSQQGNENSRMYNEMALLKMVQSMAKIAVSPPEVFEVDVQDHMQAYAYRMISRLEDWLRSTPTVSGTTLPMVKLLSSVHNTAKKDHCDTTSATSVSASDDSSNDMHRKSAGATVVNTCFTFQDKTDEQEKCQLPEFPLLPVSKGFSLTLRKHINQFRKVLQTIGIKEEP